MSDYYAKILKLNLKRIKNANPEINLDFHRHVERLSANKGSHVQYRRNPCGREIGVPSNNSVPIAALSAKGMPPISRRVTIEPRMTILC